MKKITFIALLSLVGLPMLSIGQGSLSVVVSAHNAKCNGSANGSANATVSGGTGPYTYTWAPIGGSGSSAANLAAGSYTLTVQDSKGVSSSSTITIKEPSALQVTIDSDVVFPCFLLTGPGGGGGSCGCSNRLWAVVNGGTGPYSYLWTPDSATTDTLNKACYQEFVVRVTDHNQCVTSDSIYVAIPSSTAGINEVINSTDVKIYPVPAKNVLNIAINALVANTNKLEVYDMMGKMVMEQKLKENDTQISLNISSLSPGNYLLRIAGSSSQLTSRFSITR